MKTRNCAGKNSRSQWEAGRWGLAASAASTGGWGGATCLEISMGTNCAFG
jgi:hypothetical protein